MFVVTNETKKQETILQKKNQKCDTFIGADVQFGKTTKFMFKLFVTKQVAAYFGSIV